MSGKISFWRHEAVYSAQYMLATINIIGCGAVGSNVAITAARMGWKKFSLWDSDVVENFNLANQAYFPKHIGMSKVEALKDLLVELNPDIEVETNNKFLTSESFDLIKGPVVIATDSMKSRAEFTKLFSYNLDIPFVVEARLGFDYAEVHLIDPQNPSHLDYWRRNLKSDEEIPEGPCNQRICTSLVGVVSSTMAHLLCEPYAVRRTEKGAIEGLEFKTRFMMRDNLIVRNTKID